MMYVEMVRQNCMIYERRCQPELKVSCCCTRFHVTLVHGPLRTPLGSISDTKLLWPLGGHSESSRGYTM